MNNLFLLIGCFIMSYLVFKLNKNSITSPAVLFTMGFLLSSFILYINTDIWNYDIDRHTVYFILFGNILFVLGCLVVRNKNVYLLKTENRFKNISLSTKSFFFLLVIEVIGIVSRFWVMLYLLGTMSLNNESLGEIRHVSTNTGVDLLIKIISPCITGVVIYAIIVFFSSFRNNKKIDIRSIILMLLYFIFSMLSSARIEIIYLFAYIFAYYIILYKGDRQFKIGLKVLVVSIFVIVFFYSVFFFLGYLTGKSQVQTSSFENISLYTGSSIGGLNEYLRFFNYNPNNFLTMSFNGIYTLLGYLGISIDRNPDLIDVEYFHLGNMSHSSNVYTCYLPILHDFGYNGAMIIIFIEGMILQFIYNKAKKSVVNGNMQFFYLYIYCVPLILLSSISDRFFAPFLTISTIAFLLFMTITKNILVKQ